MNKYTNITYKIKTTDVKFIEATKLVPITWRDWFWNDLSELPNAPFSWGDHNRTLTTKGHFLAYVEPILIDAEVYGDITKGERETFVREIEQLPNDVYIDMEN